MGLVSLLRACRQGHKVMNSLISPRSKGQKKFLEENIDLVPARIFSRHSRLFSIHLLNRFTLLFFFFELLPTRFHPFSPRRSLSARLSPIRPLSSPAIFLVCFPAHPPSSLFPFSSFLHTYNEVPDHFPLYRAAKKRLNPGASRHSPATTRTPLPIPMHHRRITPTRRSARPARPRPRTRTTMRPSTHCRLSLHVIPHTTTPTPAALLRTMRQLN